MKSYSNFRSHSHATLNRRAPLGLFALILACLATFSLAGCVGLTGAGTPAPQTTKTSTSDSAGSLAANATTLSFGSVVDGATITQTLTLSNTGTTAITISQAAVTGAGFNIVGGMSSVSIPAGGNQAVQVQFAPTTAGAVSGSISIASNATNSSLAITLSGTGMTALNINSQPVSQSVTTGQTATFSVSATGSGPLSYQWKKSGVVISGATGASYTTPATTSSENGAQFTVVVTDSNGSVTSSAATLTVTTSAVAPSISAQPASQTVIAGQTATFSVTAAGTGPLTYQWTKGGAAISGATSASYTTPATTTANSGNQFAVTVTNSVGNITSITATLTVNAATQLLNASHTSLNFSSVDIGSSSSLPVTFTNGGNSNVTISNVSISGAGYTASGVSSGQILTPGQTATLSVTFTPSAAGSLPGSVTVTSNATNSPESVTLSGTGVQTVSHSVTLTWTASTSTVTGYDVYRSTVSGGPYTLLNSSQDASTTYADTSVQASTTYFYVVTSVDSSGEQSADSSEVSATIP